MGTGDKLGNGLDVVATDKGVTISVTDEFDFGMFEIGSALPRRDLVLAMEKIGKVLSGAEGNDHHQRPHRRPAVQERRPTTTGGFRRRAPIRPTTCWCVPDSTRSAITEVAGFADRKLKIKNDPFNAANRRIEILLEVGG